MIVRVLEDGQYEVDEKTARELSKYDSQLSSALEKEDGRAFDEALAALIKRVHESGKKLDDDLRPSDLAVPAAGSTLAEVKKLLSSESATED
jgi:hypothetical protein